MGFVDICQKTLKRANRNFLWIKNKRRKQLTILKTILLENNLEEGFNLLTERERKIINLYYLDGYKDEEIANFYGVTRQNIFKIRKNGITKLKL